LTERLKGIESARIIVKDLSLDIGGDIGAFLKDPDRIDFARQIDVPIIGSDDQRV